MYDNEGKREDVDGTGKIKAMGLDLKRSDTCIYARLERTVVENTPGSEEQEILDRIIES